MVERELVHIEERAECTPFLIETPEHQPFNARLNNSAGAHDARLLGYVQGTTDQPEILHNLGGLHDRQDLRVGNRRTHLNSEVVGSCYRFTVRCDDECTYGHLLGSVSLAGLSQADFHKNFVLHGNNITVP
ncbi:MAG TPA: hypothetical protein VKF36_01930 [Syntrophorhabdales bacterium]|nr:hypothetical protein [Syntrophorhabdales bacterium]